MAWLTWQTEHHHVLWHYGTLWDHVYYMETVHIISYVSYVVLSLYYHVRRFELQSWCHEGKWFELWWLPWTVLTLTLLQNFPAPQLNQELPSPNSQTQASQPQVWTKASQPQVWTKASQPQVWTKVSQPQVPKKILPQPRSLKGFLSPSFWRNSQPISLKSFV